MSNLINQNWIGFDGKPATGRVPPTIRMMTGVMTPALMAEVAHRYQLFCLNKQAAVGDYFVSDRTLADGSRVRIISNTGVDSVLVWSSTEPQDAKCPHGFAVKINELPCKFYARGRVAGQVEWTIKGAVPQYGSGGSMTYANLVIGSQNDDGAMSVVLMPFVLRIKGADAYACDYWFHRVSVKNIPEGTLPVLLRQKDAKKPSPHKPYYASMSKLMNARWEVVYTFTPPASAVSGFDGDPGDHLIKLWPSQDGAGVGVSFSAIRFGILSGIAQLYAITTKSETVAVNDLGQVVPTDGHEHVFYTRPLMSDTVIDTDVSRDDLDGEVADGELKYTRIGPAQLTQTGRLWAIIQKVDGEPVVLSHLDGKIAWGVSIATPVDVSSDIVLGGDAFTQKSSEKLVEKRHPVVRLGWEDSAFLMEYVSSLDYSESKYWRSGQHTKSINLSGEKFMFDRYGADLFRIGRADSNIKLDGRPDVYLTSWDDKNMKVFSGTVKSEMRGHYYWDLKRDIFYAPTYPPGADYLITSEAYRTSSNYPGTPFDDIPEGAIIEDNVQAYADALAGDIRPMLASIQAGYNGLAYTRDEWEPLVQTVDYELFSRDILDYDHRACFWAATEVRIKCNGYKTWHPGTADVEKRLMTNKTDPEYTVTFSFVSAWKDPETGSVIRESRELKRFVVTRPLNEADSQQLGDPYSWTPGGGGAVLPLYHARMPRIAPPGDVMGMMTQITKSQGLNTNFVGINHLTGANSASSASVSRTGIEFSELRGTEEVPHTARQAGMLYARTLTLGDFRHAIWLLYATKCNITVNNIQNPDLPTWHYMPELGDFVKSSSEKWHIELRDGYLVDWSDEFQDIPTDKTQRDIKLWQV